MAEPTPERILELATGFMAAKHLFVANEIGLFQELANGPKTLSELAEQCAVPMRTLRIVADAGVALGLLVREDTRYANGPAAATFLSGHSPRDLGPMLRFWNHISYPAWLDLEAAIRSGRRPTRHGTFTPAEQKIFSEGVEAFSAAPAHALAASYDWGNHRRVLDLGGGSGSLLLALRRLHPHLRGTLFDLPPVIPVAQRRLEDDPAGIGIEVVAGDFFQDAIPGEHDAVVLANVAHLFSAARNVELLRRVRAAVPTGAHLLLVDLWTDPTHTDPRLATLMAGEFVVIAGEGDVYSEAEVRGWLREAGWRFLERRPLAGAASLLMAAAVEGAGGS